MSLDQGQQTTKTGTLTTFILNLITFSSQHNILLHLSWPLCSRENTESVYCISSKWTVDKSEKREREGRGWRSSYFRGYSINYGKAERIKAKGKYSHTYYVSPLPLFLVRYRNFHEGFGQIRSLGPGQGSLEKPHEWMTWRKYHFGKSLGGSQFWAALLDYYGRENSKNGGRSNWSETLGSPPFAFVSA